MKRDDVRRVDQIAIEDYGMLGLVLMENAGRGAAERIAALCQESPGGAAHPVCILCGPGNNGGDGYVIARHLELLGFSVHILSLVPLERLTGDASVNASIAAKAGLPLQVATSAEDLDRWITDDETVVDCLLGTGATGAPRGLYGDAVKLANKRRGLRVAIDLPTGLDCDTGIPSQPTFRADLTVTFVAEKEGFTKADAKPWLGTVRVVGIGVPQALLNDFAVA
ncbi:Bifunctional NAD(P)H-hydrate repair enzyme Nnr [Stieleria neptunia]|uniref:NAD(P)H-hydrate epimerase n=1 Tax=Stieleria neptunia TaxID=2527979 RepID=A0A518HQF5_9BACT|nr:NAD(P)H-hydrate epimerase [Stieleria neptunia]QDV43082.1 Bifunctional NAD(P)H-hydrate repair enzyme Nnr [Stieleria neptunia]